MRTRLTPGFVSAVSLENETFWINTEWAVGFASNGKGKEIITLAVIQHLFTNEVKTERKKTTNFHFSHRGWNWDLNRLNNLSSIIKYDTGGTKFIGSEFVFIES